MWRIRLCDLYCVATPMRRIPELTQLDSGKSMMRNLPPKGTAGLARQSVRFLSRLPRPPARINAYAFFVMTLTKRISASLGGTDSGDLDSVDMASSRSVEPWAGRVSNAGTDSVSKGRCSYKFL